MASVTKRGNSWRARVYYYDSTGVRRSIGHTSKSKKEAAAWAAETESSRNNENYFSLDPSSVTLYQYFNIWYETYKKRTVRESTGMNYQYIGRVIQDNFGTIPMQKITRTQYQAFLNNYGATRTKQTCEHVNSRIKTVVESAIEDEVIKHNFTNRTAIVGNESKDPNSKFLNYDDFERLMDYLKSQLTYFNPFALACLIGLRTGLRIGEVGGLTWDCINFKEQTLTVNKGFISVGTNRKTFGPTKNKQSLRTIDIDEPLVKILRTQKRLQAEEYLRHGLKNDLNQVCSGPHNIPFSGDLNTFAKNIQAQVEPPLKKIVTFHGLRHTHASVLIAHHVSIYYVSKRLGHKNINITLKTYAHMLEEVEVEEAYKTKDIFNKIG